MTGLLNCDEDELEYSLGISDSDESCGSMDDQQNASILMNTDDSEYEIDMEFLHQIAGMAQMDSTDVLSDINKIILEKCMMGTDPDDFFLQRKEALALCLIWGEPSKSS
jgi:hypothetical protein